MMPLWLKQIIRSILLGPIHRLRRAVLHGRRRRAIAKMIQRVGNRVYSGPFAGLECVPGDRLFGPMLLGTYESELRAVIEDVVRARFEHIVNVGAAGGYYAVGFLWRCSEARVTAFETSASHRAVLQRLAHRNAVAQRIAIHGYCDTATLESVVTPNERTVLLVDIEGGEASLLDPERLEFLAHTSILVELHEAFVPGVSRLLQSRFQATHRITRYESRWRTNADLPSVEGLSRRTLKLLAFEGRPGSMGWLWMTPMSLPSPQVGASAPAPTRL